MKFGNLAQLGAIKSACGAAAIAIGVALCPGAAPDTSPSSANIPTTQPTTQPAIAEDLASVKKCLAELANSDSTIRSEAITRLMSLPADALPLLQKAVEDSKPLVPAQATVLRQIVMQVFLSGEAYNGIASEGFLGIHMELVRLNFGDATPTNRADASVGMVVTETMPGFAGARILSDGDVILSIVERPGISMGSTEGFATAVRSLGADATVHFMILRQGQVRRVAVKLGARPVDADGWRVNQFMANDLLDHRRVRADEYWTRHFAALVKEGVS